MKLQRLTLAIVMAFALTTFISSCGSEGGEKVADKVENAADDMKDGAKKAADDMGDAAKKTGDKIGDAADDAMDKMDAKGTDLNFDEGSWGFSIMDFLSTGTGSKTFDLDQITQEKGEDLTPEADQQLDDLVALLKANPGVVAEIQAHSKEASNAVGKKTKKAGTSIRAEWVKLKLKTKGIDGKQLKASGHGDEKLIEGVAGDDDSQRRLTVMLTT